MQKIITILILSFIGNLLQAQTETNTQEKKGFTFGLAIGAGALSLKTTETDAQTNFSVTLPNLKFGYSFNERLAMYLTLPGATYKFEEKDRGYEGVVLTGQYWPLQKWWVSVGAGFTFDAPAFYTVSDFEEADFHTGVPALSFGTGYEILRKNKFNIDVQYRVFVGQSNLSDNVRRQGVANMFMIGFNWR